MIMRKKICFIIILVICVLCTNNSLEVKAVSNTNNKLYLNFIKNSIEFVGSYPDTNFFRLKKSKYVNISSNVLENADSITAFALVDINLDGKNELLLCNGEVEQNMLLCTIKNNKVQVRNICSSGNHEPYTYAVSIYKDKLSKNKVILSSSLSGSGAGNGFNVVRINKDFTVTPLFSYSENDMNNYKPDDFKINGKKASEKEYKNAYNTYFSNLSLIKNIPYIKLEKDALKTIQSYLENSIQIITEQSFINVGNTITFKAVKGKIKENTIWSVSNKKLATINSKTGKLSAKKTGTVIITAKAGKKKASIKLKIINISEKEIYTKLVKHYKKGTKDGKGNELVVMEGEFINKNQYNTSVQCSVPGNLTATQRLYDILVDINTGNVTQTRVLTDNEVIIYNLYTD